MRWGSQGRLNLIGALAWGKETRTLHFELVEESVKSEHVVAFIDELARNACGNQLTVVVLGPSGARTQRNNASFHTGTNIKERRQGWEEKNVFLRYLPPYAPHLNPIEALWKHLKCFLLPRRCYAAVAQLKQAVLEALNLLGAIRVNSSVGEA
jgi:putative transposase